MNDIESFQEALKELGIDWSRKSEAEREGLIISWAKGKMMGRFKAKIQSEIFGCPVSNGMFDGLG